MNKAQHFHAWFSNFLAQYDSPSFKSQDQKNSFKSITQSASNIRTSGNAESGTHESTLLLEILKDDDCEQKLLNEAARDLALGLLCGDFVIPPSARYDVISDDEKALHHGGLVLKSCKAQALSNEYLAWAGRVVGRAFAASGEIEPELLRESQLSSSLKLAPGANGSERGLFTLLQQLTVSKDSFTAGLAESALRAVVSEAAAEEDELLTTAAQKTLPEPLYLASTWQPYRTPPSDTASQRVQQDEFSSTMEDIEDAGWIRKVVTYLVQAVPEFIILSELLPILTHVKGFAEKALPFILHLALCGQMEKQQSARKFLSDALKEWLAVSSESSHHNQKHLLNALLYLRTQPLPNESSIADRASWLDVDFSSAAGAASRCGMHKTALLFFEVAASQVTRASRRSSTIRESHTPSVLLSIFENIDDPDAYYGLPQTSSLSNVMARLEYENDGSKSLAFRGAQFDSHIQSKDPASQNDGLSMVKALTAKIESANSLWDHGEMVSSIRMLQSIDNDSVFKKQSIPVSRSDLMSKIGYQISVAKLEKPHDIQRKYLEPALKELKGRTDGKDAGKVFHQFAMFCDEQLQNSDGLDDLARLQNLKQGKSDEVAQLRSLISSEKNSQTKSRYSSHLTRAQQWLHLDEQELRRVEQTRSEFVRLSLENYLLSLIASDEHNNDALRFTALWLERSDDDSTNDAVRRHLDKVPTRKFATLMNQLCSRLQDQSNIFQRLLINLVYNICIDHPYHSMYQVWSGVKVKANSKDEVAVLRHKATNKVKDQLEKHPTQGAIWHAIDRTNGHYHRLAVDRDNPKYKAGHKINLKETTSGNYLVAALNKYQIPPPTMQLELSADKDYSKAPIIARLEPQMSIASGVSAPKIITAVGTDGVRYKQLVKGGNDDLRQDAIMEQVFAAVSSLLKLHRETQRRNLGIRTYKVLPLTSASGLIEFVPNTIPLHEFLMPAHERYYPKDLKGSQCRKEISAVQGKSVDARVSAYRKVKERFHPVMKYFFMEYFVDPDEWFVKRTAYTRTTAAISMLGHILGLGDRHGHNILLDNKTGEVVHIDLGVAFEMGRVLPVPELVPFRLTRDIEDGMGVTKEGVFQRCCEFTLDALREETYSIMTILDVLRYDPLYSWSISPVRLAKLQGGSGDGDDDVAGRGKTRVNEPSEADRALEVVRKKLSKTLSVTATVNDLINQATDERNLAVLYSGWAAYA
ncbi:hypothetical protein ACHAP6_000119 [Verticillium nonalfalfae]